MVADGVIARQELNLRSLGAYFKSHPEAEEKYLWLNERTVFFSERPGGPFGKLNVPVTAFATIATDKEVYPRAMPAFLSVPIPRTDDPGATWHFRGFMLDQDSGGAIRAAGRCDIYMGIGDQAESMAGHQLNEGELYYIALKPELMPRYAAPTPAETIPPQPKTTTEKKR
jgi:membrane-bound lytic murein transglycosylase A